MPLYTLYIRNSDNEELIRDAKRVGSTPRDLLKKRIEKASQTDSHRTFEIKLDALLLLVEMLAAEIGYTSGATRAASANAPKAVSEGTALEASLKKAVQTLRSRLQQQGAEVRL